MVRPPVCDSSHRACSSVLLVLVSAMPAWAGPSKAPAEPPESIVAIADVHNAFDDFVAILRHTGLIDTQNHWTGGKTTFVQVGDLLDRGPKPREVMDLMMALEKEAVQAGGRVVSLLGNHEVMNIMGDLRYVVPVNYASFADGNSEKRQKAAYDEYVKWRGNQTSLLADLPQPMELTETEWMARHPAGFIEHREAFGPKGEYGRWLRGHAAVAEIDGIIFLHGGIHPDLAKTKLDAMNNRIHDEIKAFDASKEYLQNEKLILPFFNLQEINNVLQAEVIAELKSHVPTNDERRAKIQEFLRHVDWLSVRVDERRGCTAGEQALGGLQGDTPCSRAHGAEGWSHPASLWQQSVPDRHRHAQQLLPRRQGISFGNLRRCQIHRCVSGPAGSASRFPWVFASKRRAW
jgi:hypothetical protein